MLAGAHEQNLSAMMAKVVELPRSTVNAFEREAYGAALTIVYFRAMPLAVRTDIHMRLMERGYLWGGKAPKGVSLDELKARRAFYSKLSILHQTTFEWASFDAIKNSNDPAPYQPEPLIDHPWSLSDSEFSDGMVLLRHGKMPDLTGEGAEGNEALTQGRNATGAVLKDEFLDFMADFLQEAGKDLRPLLRTGVRFVGRASVIGAVLETLIDILASGRVAYVRDLFDKDEPRRLFLSSMGWGDYRKPAPMVAPTAPAYAPRTGRF